MNDRSRALVSAFGSAKTSLRKLYAPGRFAWSVLASCELSSTSSRSRYECSFVVSAQSRSEEHTSELQSHLNLVCRLLLGSKEHTSELQSHLNLVCRLLLE